MATQAQLDEARAALHDLIIGKKAVKLKKDGREIEFTPATKMSLEQYIRQLQTELGVSHRRPAGVRI